MHAVSFTLVIQLIEHIWCWWHANCGFGIFFCTGCYKYCLCYYHIMWVDSWWVLWSPGDCLQHILSRHCL